MGELKYETTYLKLESAIETMLDYIFKKNGLSVEIEDYTTLHLETILNSYGYFEKCVVHFKKKYANEKKKEYKDEAERFTRLKEKYDNKHKIELETLKLKKGNVKNVIVLNSFDEANRILSDAIISNPFKNNYFSEVTFEEEKIFLTINEKKYILFYVVERENISKVLNGEEVSSLLSFLDLKDYGELKVSILNNKEYNTKALFNKNFDIVVDL